MNESDYRIGAAAARETTRRLLDENEQLRFNLFELVFSVPDAFACSDGKSFLLGQAFPATPLWVWLADTISDEAMARVAAIIAERLSACPELHVNMQTDRSGPLVRHVEKLSGKRLVSYLEMNAYACRRILTPALSGEMICASEAERPAITALLRQFAEDAQHRSMSKQEADDYARHMIDSRKLSLWRDGGEICAMALIAQESDKAARFNTVVTEREKRGKGYAGMLLSQMCFRILEKGRVPMLYADAAYPSSNRAYRKIGFEPLGQITEYACES